MPQSEYAHFALANVLLMSTQDAETARGVFAERWRHISSDSFDPEPPEVVRLADEYRMAIATGALERALGLVRKWNELVAAMPTGRFRGDPLIELIELIELLRELGKNDEARMLASNGLKEQRAWTGDEKLDVSIEFARLAYLTGGIGVDEYRRLRADWRERKPHIVSKLWLSGFAGLPVVGREMAPPSASGELVEDWYTMDPETFSRAAEEFIRAGRIQDAIQHADAAAGTCLIFKPMSYIHALVVALKGHDAAGDVPAACERYAMVQRLLAKTPSSTSLRLANKRLAELSCQLSVPLSEYCRWVTSYRWNTDRLTDGSHSHSRMPKR